MSSVTDMPTLEEALASPPKNNDSSTDIDSSNSGQVEGGEMTPETCDQSSAKKIKCDRYYGRSVKLQWFVDFPWLVTDEALLKCSVCVEAQKRNVFTTGKDICKPKRDDLVKHEKTSDHKDAASKPQATEEFRYDCMRSAISAQMKTVLVQATRGMAMSKNMAFVELQIANGLGALKDLQTDEWLNHYPHSDCINDILQALASVVRQELESKRRSSPYAFYSIIVDEISNIAKKPLALVYVRFMAIDGGAETQLLGMTEFVNADVEDMYFGIKKLLEENRLRDEHMVSLVIDGASAMSEVNRGVTARFKEDLPYLIVSHCLAHRLPLVVEKAAWGVPYLGKYENILRLLAKAIKFSPQFTRLLATATDYREAEKFAKLQCVLMSDSFCLVESVQVVAGSLRSIFNCMTEALVDPDVEGKGILESLIGKMLSYRFVMMTQFLADATGVMEMLMATMCQKGIRFAKLMFRFQDSRLAVQNLLSDPAKHVKYAKGELPEKPNENGFSIYHGHNIKDSQSERDKFQECAEMLIADLVVSVEKMFPDNDLFCGFDAFSPKSWQDNDDEKFNELVNNFQGIIDVSAALVEWNSLKDIIQQKQYSNLIFTGFFSQFIRKNLNIYPNLGRLAAIGIILPVWTPQCEDGIEVFSVATMNNENTALLTDVEDVVTLATHAKPLYAFNFDAAFEMWTDVMDKRRYEQQIDDWKMINFENEAS